MPRAALAAFTFLALGLALPRLAAADDAMCGVRPAVSLGEGAREAWLEEVALSRVLGALPPAVLPPGFTNRVVAAVERIEALPYRGFEKVFKREIEFIFIYDGD